jgi:YegS/Rv2252/BmrU family lipid kinase
VKRSIELVVNPRAGAGKAAKILGDVTRELASVGFDVQVHRTERPRHAGEIVRRLVRDRADIIAVMGGDGSFHEALAGLRSEDGEWLDASKVAFALIPAGTGGDLKRTLRIPEDPRAIANYLAHAQSRPFDVGSVTYESHHGERETLVFGNIASFGMSGLVDRLVNEGPKWLGGRMAFLSAALRVNVVYRNVPVRVFVDDQLFHEGPINTVAIANGRFFGGGMKVAPLADPHDGLLDVVVLGDMAKLESVGFSRHLYAGTLLGQPKVSHTRGRVVRAEAIGSQQGLLDVDGEAPGRLPATFTIHPAAIQILKRE